MNMNETNEFITKVFNYFNGKVNLFQRARLFINWCEVPSSANGGLTTNPNCVTIFPCVIERYSSTEIDFLLNVILIIIHELYHVDQCINFGRMAINKQYHDMIENTVEVQSMSYLYNHANEINTVFGININFSSAKINDYIDHFADNNLYHRKKYLDHIISIANDLFNYEYCVRNGVDELIAQYYNTLNSKIIIIINDKVLIVKDYDKLTNVNKLNDFIFDNCLIYNYIVYSEGDIWGENNELFIQINAELRNYIAEVK